MAKKDLKIKDEELTIIKEHQQKINTALKNIGFVESQKHNLLHEYAGLLNEVEKYKIELEELYGSVNIDIETGLYTPIEEKK